MNPIVHFVALIDIAVCGEVTLNQICEAPTLNYTREQIWEAYYKCDVARWVQLSPDVQYIRNPGYNSARGPSWVYALRVHFEL
ncbi:MAG: hypothetical protein EAZ47_08050 [Bacteroidetes bacterium]|nr:MAG: hypothetical protein EAY72_07900 [Bacteroidota bacterium]TAF92903.1 MAG: hypothetical protein EAZ47_08050 [Bacteroidota bacterium]